MTFFLIEDLAPPSQGPRLSLPRSEHAEIAATLAAGACATVVLSVLVLTQLTRGPPPLVPSLTALPAALSVAALSAAAFAFLRFQSCPRTLPGEITHRDALARLAAAFLHLAPAAVTSVSAISAAATGGPGAPENPPGFWLFNIAAPAFVFGLPSCWLARIWVRHRRQIPVGPELEIEGMGFALAAQIVSIAFLAVVLAITSLPTSD
jgi:hypothetical protein